MITDEELARQLQQGNKVAFETLVHRYHGPIYGFVYRRLQGCPDVEDLVQKTFLRVLTRIELYEFPRPFKPWLYGIALNLCRDYRRSGDRDVVISTDAVQRQRGADLIFPKLQARSDLVAALAALEAPYQEVLILRFFEELKIKEIAAALYIPEGTAKWRLFQALRLMREQLEKGGYSGAAEQGPS